MNRLTNNLIQLLHTRVNGPRIVSDPKRDCESTEKRKTENVQVTSTIQIHKLQTAQADSCDDSEHAEKVGANYRVRDCRKKGPHFAKTA